MAGIVDFDFEDLSKFERALGEHKKLFPYIANDAVRKAQREAVKEIKAAASARGYRKGKSGHIIKNIFEWTNKGKEMFSYIGFKSRTFAYANTANGGTITAKNSEYLTFYRDGSWHKVRQVTIAPQGDWAGDIVRNYWNSGKATPIMEAEFERQIIRIYERELRRLSK